MDSLAKVRQAGLIGNQRYSSRTMVRCLQAGQILPWLQAAPGRPRWLTKRTHYMDTTKCSTGWLTYYGDGVDNTGKNADRPTAFLATDFQLCKTGWLKSRMLPSWRLVLRFRPYENRLWSMIGTWYYM